MNYCRVCGTEINDTSATLDICRKCMVETKPMPELTTAEKLLWLAENCKVFQNFTYPDGSGTIYISQRIRPFIYGEVNPSRYSGLTADYKTLSEAVNAAYEFCKEGL